MILSNVFSLNMFADLQTTGSVITITPLTFYQAARKLDAGFISAVENTNIARIFTNLLKLHVHPSRATVFLGEGASLIVGQYIGPRLPEGATSLPEGADIRWLLVEVS
jgi:hypothetical protein